MLSFDATTLGEYDANVYAADRAAAVVAALGGATGTVNVKVYNGSGTLMGSGVLSAPWAVASGNTITVGSLSSFAVLVSGNPDPATWYLRFENAAGRYLRGTFGLPNSGADFTWSLSTWATNQTAQIGSIVCTASNGFGWTIPSSSTLSIGTYPNTGGSYSLSQHALTSSGTPNYLNVSGPGAVGLSTGTLTIPSALAAAYYTQVVSLSNAGSNAQSRTFGYTVQASTATTAGFKWYPGHYALLPQNNTASQRQSLAAEVAASGGWKGIQPRYYWGDLESSLGVYNFSSIKTDADYCQSLGLKLFIQIPWARFNNPPTIGNLLPAYAQTSTYEGGCYALTDRYALRVWNANLMSRLIALEEALAAWADDHPAIAGIVGGETALGAFGDISGFGYTASGVITQYKRRIDSTSASWSSTPAVFYTNFFPGWSSAQITDFFNYCVARKVGFGGPDIIPNTPTLGQAEYMGQGGSPDYRGVVPIANANQTQSMEGWSIQTLSTYGISTLGSNFINTLYSVSAPVSSWSQTKAYVAANPNTVMNKPTKYSLIRFAPGHYIRPGLNDPLSSVLSQISSYDSRVRGIISLRYWKNIETSQGVYDWSYWDAIANACVTEGKTFIFRVQDRAFGVTTPASAVPSYIVNASPSLTYFRTNTNNEAAGAALWRAAAMNHLIRVYKAVLDRYSSYPNFVGIAGEESVYGDQISTNYADYVGSDYANLEISRAQQLRAYAPSIPYYLYTNWFTEDDDSSTLMQRWFAACRADPGIFTSYGPDTRWILGNVIDGRDVMRGAVGGIDHRGKYGGVGSTENVEFRNGATAAQIYAAAVTEMRVNIMSWSTNPTQWTQDAYPYIGTHPTVTTVPTELVGRVEII